MRERRRGPQTPAEKFAYARGVLRNRLSFYPEAMRDRYDGLIGLAIRAFENAGCDAQAVIDRAKTITGISHLRQWVREATGTGLP